LSLKIVKKNVLDVGADVLVLSANPSLLAGGGISGVVHKIAGRELEQEAISYGPIKPGEAVVTRGYKLGCKHVVHTVCPRYMYGSLQEEDLLAAAYRCALNSYEELTEVKSVAFVSMGTGIYGWPMEKAAHIAVRELRNSRFDLTYMCLMDNHTANIYQAAYDRLICESK